MVVFGSFTTECLSVTFCDSDGCSVTVHFRGEYKDTGDYASSATEGSKVRANRKLQQITWRSIYTVKNSVHLDFNQRWYVFQ